MGVRRWWVMVGFRMPDLRLKEVAVLQALAGGFLEEVSRRRLEMLKPMRE